MLKFFSYSTAYALRGKHVELYNCFLPSTIEKVFFQGALCAPKISATEKPYISKLHHLLSHLYHLCHLHHLLSHYQVDLICKIDGCKPYPTRIGDIEIDKCIQFILILER